MFKLETVLGDVTIDPLWKTSSGDRLALPEMDTAHVHNAINMLRRNPQPNTDHNIEVLNGELYRRSGRSTESS